jgi:hypothetical protein
MNTSAENKTKFRRAYVPTSALAKESTFDATSTHRTNDEIEIGGLALHWPEIDEDISVAKLLAGVDHQFI